MATPKARSLAERFIEAWHSQVKTISSSDLAKQIDNQVSVTKSINPSQIRYDFSDHTSAQTTGRGRNFIISHI